MRRGLGADETGAGFVFITWPAAVIGEHCVLENKGSAVVGAGGVTGFRAKFAGEAGDVLAAGGAGMAGLVMFGVAEGSAVSGAGVFCKTWGAGIVAVRCAGKTRCS